MERIRATAELAVRSCVAVRVLPAPAGRTAAIVRAVADEVARRRAILDGPEPPQHVAILVYLSRAGQPVRVTCEPKWSRDLEREGR